MRPRGCARVPIAMRLLFAGLGVTIVCALAAEVDHELSDVPQWTEDLDAADVERRVAALDRYSLGTSDWPQPVPCAALSRRMRDTAVRASALPALVRVVRGGKCLDDVIAALVSGPDAATRALAARALGSAPHAALALVEQPLIAVAQRDDSSAIAAVVALGQLADTTTAVRHVLVGAFRRGAETMRIEALESLMRTSDPEDLVPFIESAMVDDSPSVRAASVFALSGTGDMVQTNPRIASRLRLRAGDSSVEVRNLHRELDERKAGAGVRRHR